MTQKISNIAETTKFLSPTPQTQVVEDAIAEEKKVDEENIANKPSPMAASERLLVCVSHGHRYSIQFNVVD